MNHPARAAQTANHRAVLARVVGVAALTAVLVSASGGPFALLLALVPGAIGVAYNAPVLPGPGADRLKAVLVVNTAATALAWAIPVALLPVAFASVPVGPGALAVAAFVFGRTYVASEFANVDDAPGDAATGVATLPVVVGRRRTRWLLFGGDLLSATILVGAVASGLVGPATALALLAGVAVSAAVVQPAVDLAAADRRPTLRDLEFVVAAALLAV